MRQVVLDTETTGLDPADGHRIIEIGCVELVDRRLTGARFHEYLQPEREIDAGAIEVHGITNEFLRDKPRFADVVNAFLAFVRDAELIIHNAPFDIGFLHHELQRCGSEVSDLAAVCSICDTLPMARRKHPGARASLDALCKRYGVDATDRTLHGALLDAELLADVYLAMTGGQVSLGLASGDGTEGLAERRHTRSGALPVIAPNADEQAAHAALVTLLQQASGERRWPDA